MPNVSPLNAQPRGIDLSGLDDEELFDATSSAVREEMERLSAQADALTQRACDLEDIDFDDPRLRRRIKDERERLSVERLQEIWSEVTKPEREREERERVVRSKVHQKSAGLRYYTITNARRNTIHILAQDAEVARYIAYRNNRITDKSQGNLRPFDAPAMEKLSYRKGIEQALAAG